MSHFGAYIEYSVIYENLNLHRWLSENCKYKVCNVIGACNALKFKTKEMYDLILRLKHNCLFDSEYSHTSKSLAEHYLAWVRERNAEGMIQPSQSKGYRYLRDHMVDLANLYLNMKTEGEIGLIHTHKGLFVYLLRSVVPSDTDDPNGCIMDFLAKYKEEGNTMEESLVKIGLIGDQVKLNPTYREVE